MKRITYLATLLFVPLALMAQTNSKPNILVIWGDDIGTWNISHNNRGMICMWVNY
jgi:Spy/CpxP family protein refolding chaperone